MHCNPYPRIRFFDPSQILCQSCSTVLALESYDLSFFYLTGAEDDEPKAKKKESTKKLKRQKMKEQRDGGM